MSKSNNQLDAVSEGYLGYLRDVSRKTHRTIIDVRCSLRRVTAVMADEYPDQPLWKLPLTAYLNWLEHERARGTTGSTLCKYLSHVRGLLDYAWRSGRSDRNVLDGFALQEGHTRRKPQVLSLAEARALVDSCPRSTKLERRDRVAILLLYGCGLRTQELSALTMPDIDRDRHELLIRHGKGDRQRIVPIPDAVFTELLAYLLERGGKTGAVLRPEGRGKRLSSHAICDIVRRAAECAKIAWLVTPRTLRHSYATHLMDAGVDLAVISSLMGHRSPAETGVYLHVLEDKPRSAVSHLTKGGHAS